MRPSLALVAATLCVERTSATILLRGFIHSWLGAPFFRTPGNVNNVCSSEQKKGWSFDDLDILKPITEYGGLILDGFSCDEEPKSASRSRLERRTILKHLKGDCGLQHGKAPSISSGDKNKGFSIKQLEVACPRTGSLALRYTMPDGNTCETTSHCQRGKFLVDNDQCGGAVKVSFVFKRSSKLGAIFDGMGVCWIRLFNVVWDCESSKYPLELPAVRGGGGQGGSSTQTGQQENGVEGHKLRLETGSKVGEISLQTGTEPGNLSLQTGSEVGKSSLQTGTEPGKFSYKTGSEVGKSSLQTSEPGKFSYKTGSEVGKLSLQTGSEPGLPHQTTQAQQLPPPSVTSFSGEQTSATSTGAVDRIVTAPYQDVPVPSGEAPFPPCVPSCINTFIKELGMTCKNNLDVGCYCQSKELVRSLYPCFFAHRKDDDEFAKAKEFFRGLCARYIPQNPEIATGAESILASMTITGTPCFKPADYTTVVVPATQVATDGATITVTTTMAIPEIELPTPGPVAPTGGLEREDGPEISPPRPDGPDFSPPKPEDEPSLSPPKPEDESSLSPPKPDDEAEEKKNGEMRSDEKTGPIVSRPELIKADEAQEGPSFDSNPSSPQTNGPEDGPSPDSPYQSPETTGAQSGPGGSTPDSVKDSDDTDGPSLRRPQKSRKVRPGSGRGSNCLAPVEAQSRLGNNGPEREATPEEPSYSSPKQEASPVEPNYSSPKQEASPIEPNYSSPNLEAPSEEPSYSTPKPEDAPVRPSPKRLESPEADEPQLAPGADTDAPKKNVINLKMVPPSATQRNSSTSGPSKTSFGGITVGTGAYAAPAHSDGRLIE
ncbi:hypothetical protein CDD80_1954 [Ophiocordyceps camponoti-rufipedis]|uniref:CFEM domain-containing protein n=1 Tax=Ophiocordyceps camponoti-rufipedis TaxID=2004952 RepID=A0A2C5XL41_9HYPO|nr:hypothetical protein CDD80_1954 [Ophiocordyceps camponoti-rufipedis]